MAEKAEEMAEETEVKVSKRRVFRYKDQEFTDPGAEFSNEQVLQVVAASIPELAGGDIKTEDEGDVTVVTFEPKPKRLG